MHKARANGGSSDIRSSIRHDFSTSHEGIVPLSERRPLWHLTALWTTLAANFSFLFLGVALYVGGYTLEATVGITALGCALYIAYAVPASYLGSRTGQTHALLTRSIFGRGGSWLVGLFVLIAPLGWVGFTAGLLAQTWTGLLRTGNVLQLTVSLAFLMIAANLLGFTGISAIARYLVAPLMIVWVAYFVCRALIINGASLEVPSHHVTLPYWAAVGSVIGFAMWGNEPDVWRYGRPKLVDPLLTLVFSYFWFVLFVVAGWVMSRLANSAQFGSEIRFMTNYSLLGKVWIAFAVASVSLFAVNDGNYYESINAGQNLIGGWRRWRRQYTCLALAPLGALAAYLVNFGFVNGWFKVAGFLAITVPCATTIMVIDQFMLSRLFKVVRPVEPIPGWKSTGMANVPGIIALLVAVAYGAYASSLYSFSGIASNRYWGPVPLEAWAIAAVLYLSLVGLVAALFPNRIRSLLGFSDNALITPSRNNTPQSRDLGEE